MANRSLWEPRESDSTRFRGNDGSNPLSREAEPRFRTRLELHQEFGVLGSDGGLSMSRAMDIEMIMDHFLDGDCK